jgi:hypothetical protein
VYKVRCLWSSQLPFGKIRKRKKRKYQIKVHVEHAVARQGVQCPKQTKDHPNYSNACQPSSPADLFPA